MNQKLTAKQERVRLLTKGYYEQSYGGVVPPNLTIDELITRVSSANTQLQQNEWFRKHIRISKKQKIFDYGSGTGGLVIYLNKKGYRATGGEVDSRLVKISKLNASLEGISGNIFIKVKPNKIPLKDESADTVLSYFVAEHVADLEKYLSESLRVLKPGGNMLLTTCNYIIGWEFHYQMWLPLFSKPLSKLILRLKKRKTAFFDDLCFVTPKMISSVFSNLKSKYVFLTNNIGEKTFDQSLDLGFSDKHSPQFLFLFKIIKFLALGKIFKKIGLYNPQIYLITKIGNNDKKS